MKFMGYATQCCKFWLLSLALLLTIGVQAQKSPTPTPVSAGIIRTDDAGIPQVWIPAGSFIAGSTQEQADAAYQLCLDIYPGMCLAHEYAAELFQHEATLTYSYWLDAYEVTNTAYQAFVEADGYTTRAYWSDEGWLWKGQRTKPHDNGCPRELLEPALPRTCITWYEADAYARWRGGSLPTEAEWEYAARGQEGRVYPWGDEPDSTRFNSCDAACPNVWRDLTLDDGAARSAPVGSYPAGKSWTGAYNLAGNVWEWTADWFDPLYNQSENTVNPTAPAHGIEKVIKGGAWNMPALFSRSAYRDGILPDSWSGIIGFRIVTHAGMIP